MFELDFKKKVISKIKEGYFVFDGDIWVEVEKVGFQRTPYHNSEHYGIFTKNLKFLPYKHDVKLLVGIPTNTLKLELKSK